jgi:hypothetical protein
MSYYLIDFIKEPDFNFDNLIIGKKINSDQNYSKYYIYYDQNNTASEIYIKLPKIRSIYNLSNYKFNSLNVPIYPDYDLTKKFIKFIKELEDNINECYKKKNREFVSLITKKNSLQFIKIGINDNIKITSNTNKNITMNDFKINSELEIVIKLSYVWVNQNKIGLSSQIYQIKYYAPPCELDINFIDEEIVVPKKMIHETEVISYTPLPKPLSKPTVQLTQNNIIIRPSLTDINNALKSLKRIE